MVQQHFALFEGMTALENIALALPKPPPDLRAQILSVGDEYGLKIDPDALVFTLSAGEKQRIEIVRALLGNPRILVLDEPTSVLTPQEADTLFIALKKARGQGKGLIFISHKLGEVKALCDAATILRGGRLISTCDPRETSTQELAEHMIGKRTVAAARATPLDVVGETALSLSNIKTYSGLSVPDLQVHQGEVVGIAGIAGNGQDRLFAFISGEETEGSGRSYLKGGKCPCFRPKSPSCLRGTILCLRSVWAIRPCLISVSLKIRCSPSILANPANTLLGRRSWIQKTARDVIEYFDVRGGMSGLAHRPFQAAICKSLLLGGN